jgi:hypothetical protein
MQSMAAETVLRIGQLVILLSRPEPETHSGLAY